jgi:hypothetical protein
MAKVLQYISLRGLWLRTSFWNEGVPSYLDPFYINYIIFRNFVNLRKNLPNHKNWILMNILFLEINISKWINYSTHMCWNGQGTMIHFFEGLMIENFISKWRSTPATLAALTLIIILRNVEIFKKYLFKITKYSEQKYWIFRNILFHEINILIH